MTEKLMIAEPIHRPEKRDDGLLEGHFAVVEPDGQRHPLLLVSALLAIQHPPAWVGSRIGHTRAGSGAVTGGDSTSTCGSQSSHRGRYHVRSSKTASALGNTT